MNKGKLEQYFSSAKIACGWILGIQAFSTIYSLITGLMNHDEEMVINGIFVGFVGVILLWLINRFRKECNFKNSSTLFLTCFGMDAFDIGHWVAVGNWTTFALKLAIAIPTLFFLGRITKATIFSKGITKAKRLPAKN